MKNLALWIVAIAFTAVAFSLPVYGGSTNLPAHGSSAGTSFTLSCGDGKVLIGLKGKKGMSLGNLQGLCRRISSEGRWLGSTTYTETSGGAGGIYPIIPTSFTITCPEDFAVEGLSGSHNGFVVQVGLVCFGQAPVSLGSGFLRSVSAPLQSGNTESWDEDRCPDGKPGRGLHGRFSTAGVRAIGLVCHSGSTPNLEVLAAPNELAAVNLVGPNGPPATTVTPFVQLSWIDRSTIETGFRLNITSINPGTLRNIDRPAATGVGVRQAVNVTDLPDGGYFFQVCSNFSPADGGNRCSIPLAIFSIAQATTCSPTITSVEQLSTSLARVRWTHSCANPPNFLIRLRSGNAAETTAATAFNGTDRDENFTYFPGTDSAVRVCANFSQDSSLTSCSAARTFRFELPGE